MHSQIGARCSARATAVRRGSLTPPKPALPPSGKVGRPCHNKLPGSCRLLAPSASLADFRLWRAAEARAEKFERSRLTAAAKNQFDFNCLTDIGREINDRGRRFIELLIDRHRSLS